MPEFAPGVIKVAEVPVMVSPQGLSCEAELYLGPDENTKISSSGTVAFTSTGALQNIQLPLTMPLSDGSYHVYVDVLAEGVLVGAYQAFENIIIVSEDIPVPTVSQTVGIRVINPPTGAKYWRYSLWFDSKGRGTNLLPITKYGYVDRKNGYITALYFYTEDDYNTPIGGMQSWTAEEPEYYEKYNIKYRPPIYVTEYGLYIYDWATHTLTKEE